MAFKSGINTINHTNDIIHITSQTIKPVCRNKKMVITIHDVIPFHRNIENVEGIYGIMDNHEYYVKKGYERAKYYASSTIKEKLISYYNGIL